MTFRTRLFVAFVGTSVAATAVVSWSISQAATRAFEQVYESRAQSLAAQFRREFASQGEEVARRLQGIAGGETIQRMSIELARGADASFYVNEAAALAKSQALDFLDLIGADGAIISSAHWAARFGYKTEWVNRGDDWNSRGAFFERLETPERPALALLAVRVVIKGDRKLYLVGGRRLDEGFLSTLSMPAGMEARFEAPAGRVPDDGRHRLPLEGRDGQLLSVIALESSRSELDALTALIRTIGVLAGIGGVLVGAMVSGWATARVTRPVQQLARGAQQVAAGDWSARVEAQSGDEIGEMARAFNEMTRQLIEQRERLVQTERVAAWRELARRLAHELKNPLFPLQITIENLRRAREQAPGQFDEIFRESTTTLLAELANMKTIVGRFSDFAKMPPPQPEAVDVNQLARQALKLLEPQLDGRVKTELALAVPIPSVQADPEQLTRALRNLILNALDAMPDGGTLAIRTAAGDDGVRIEVSDTGAGLTPEERERLFTPYYTTKQHGTGLGLAIVQSVVSDHRGRITVESEPGRGATFRIDLPWNPACPTS